MKNFIKKTFSIFLCLLVLSSSFMGVVASAAYPSGVSQAESLSAIKGTDNLLANIVPALTGQDLKSAVKHTLYSNETLSSMLVETYSSLGESSNELQMIGVDCSTKTLSAALKNYPQICVALYNAETWAEVDLTGVNWGVTTKEGFADAVAAIFSPFNDLLYMLLCGGRYTMNGFITINGANGYENAIVPLLEAMNCTNLPSQTMFTLEAQKDKSSMLRSILIPVFSTVEWVLESPANNLSEVLPGMAYFIDSGEFNACFQSLLSPITSNPLVEIAVFLKILDLDSLTNIDVNSLMSSLVSGEGGLQLANMDFAALAACGKMTDSGYVPDKAMAYVEILRWIIESLKLNKDNLGELSAMAGGEKMDMSFLSGILEKDTDSLVAMIILLFTPAPQQAPKPMVYPEFKSGSVQNPTKLTDKNFEKVYNEIDDLLDQFVKESGAYGSVGAMLTGSVYTNANINAALTGIYKMLEDEGLTGVLALLGINATPKGVAALLTENSYSGARKALNRADSWSEVSLKGVTWGFNNGSRRGFQDALVAIFRPLFPLLRVVLAGETLVVFDSVVIAGSDGYNTAIIPILEALGCEESSIKSYSSYKSRANGDGVLDNVLEPVFDLLDSLGRKPVQTLVDILPNVVYFMESGSLESCISNLLIPITSIFNRVPGVVDFSLDASALTKELDLNKILGDMLQGSGIKFAEFDIKTLASLGKATERTSKSVIDGKRVKYTYIESDKNAIILSLLQIVAKTLKMPGNETLLMGSMGSTNANFDTSSITSQFASMTEAELIEWLYNLFFKERVQFQLVQGEDYKPTIIYTPEEKDNTALYIFLGYLGICAVVGVILLINRKRLYGDVED